VSFESGVGRLPGAGLGVACADFNSDGWIDIFVANDGNPNRLWINKKDGTFADEGVSRGIAYTEMGRAFAGMGVGVGDINNDGLLDLYATHLGSETNTLWRQDRPGMFRDKTGEAGLLATQFRGTGFGTLMADFNNDGWIDIAVANGRVFRGGDAKNTGMGYWETYLEKNQLFANDGSGKFRDISASNPAFCDYWNVARGLVAADFDNDGAVDLLVAPLGGKARLFRNTAGHRGHWLKVRAFDPKTNRESYGAEVRVRAGGKDYLRVVNPAESYLCSGSSVVHFGLGAAESIESICVAWPDGKGTTKEVFAGGPVNRLIELRRGGGRQP
jgi:enediyne biosynthesis protein E4